MSMIMMMTNNWIFYPALQKPTVKQS